MAQRSGDQSTPDTTSTSSTANTPNVSDTVSRADFNTLKRKVDDLESRLSDVDDAYELESTSDDFGGLTRDEFLHELADAVYGKGVRPVRPGQFDVSDKK